MLKNNCYKFLCITLGGYPWRKIQYGASHGQAIRLLDQGRSDRHGQKTYRVYYGSKQFYNRTFLFYLEIRGIVARSPDTEEPMWLSGKMREKDSGFNPHTWPNK